MYQEIIDFWFTELKPKQWWQKDTAFDLMIQTRFGELLDQAKANELFQWREAALGSLAEVIVLDQFSRNIYREKPESFASDSLALALAQFAISKGFDRDLPDVQRIFLYMPFMHSESVGIQSNIDFEYKHKVIIDKFGRYPHRNQILGRQSTDEEIEFLKQENSGF
jgi:uncharacterized protein (DUF924 family)